MVKPSIAELSNGNMYNRYTLVMMAAKGAKYVVDRENFAKEHPELAETGYNAGDIEIDFNNKPVKSAIKLFHEGKIKIKLPEEAERAWEEHDKTSLSEEII